MEHSSPPGPAYGWVPPWGPAPGRSSESSAAVRPRWGGTIAVALIAAAVVLGGIAVDGALPEPTAGRVAVNAPVYITASPGWVETGAGDIPDGIELQHSSALMVAEVLSADYTGDSKQLMATSKASFARDAAEISFGDERDVSLNGKPASIVAFSALLSGSAGAGMVDGELVCLVLHSGANDYAVFIQVGVPQGYLASVSDDVEAMAGTLGVGR